MKNKVKKDSNRALMLGVLDVNSDIRMHVRLYMELKKNITKAKRDITATSLFKAHINPNTSRKQHNQFLKIFGVDSYKCLLIEPIKKPACSMNTWGIKGILAAC